jgi:hypothetical protein
LVLLAGTKYLWLLCSAITFPVSASTTITPRWAPIRLSSRATSVFTFTGSAGVPHNFAVGLQDAKSAAIAKTYKKSFFIFYRSIKNKINELVKQKSKLKHIEKSNKIKKPEYYLKKYDNNNWDIICVNIIGKIIKINDTFDLLMMYNNEIYNEQYDSLEESLVGLNYMLN